MLCQNKPRKESAYQNGYEAALRINQYSHYKTAPPCPFEDADKVYQWWGGFAKGTEYLQGQLEDW